MTDSSRTESFALRLSLVGNLMMALLGLLFATLTHSEAILLDGAYSFISFLMVILATKVSRLVDIPETEHFQFGHAQFEPLLNTVRGLLILILLIFAVGSAISALNSGGRALNPSLALVYSVSIGSICIALSFVQRRFAKKTNSPILQVDARTWLMDGMLTAVVGVAFLASLFLQRSSFAHLLPYVDPTLVILMALLMVRVPLSMVKNNVGELLQCAPPPDIQKVIRQKIAVITKPLPLQGTNIRMVKVGRFFYILVALIVRKEFPCESVASLDQIRNQIAESVRGSHPRLVIDTIFTMDRKWDFTELE